MSCPDCFDTYRSLKAIQLCLMADELQQLTAKAASFGPHTRRCVRCGLVYVRSSPPHRLGWLNGSKGPGFYPVPEYA